MAIAETLAERIVALIASTPGATDRELTDALWGSSAGPQRVGAECRRLAGSGRVERRARPSGGLGNYPGSALAIPLPCELPDNDSLSEDNLKDALDKHLRSAGWATTIAMGKRPGIDIVAKRGAERWIIEVKGCGSRDAMRVNYFLAIMGELLQRMNDDAAKYSIAIPDLPQFRGLWNRLPKLAKDRTKITAIFVSEAGEIHEAVD
jgi:hypothetical protein